MKVPGSDSNENKRPELLQARERGQSAPVRQDGEHAIKEKGPSPHSQGVDSVQVSTLAGLLKDELNPTAMAAERRQKVEDLKRRILEGSYNPSSLAVADAIGQELSLEILTSGEPGKEKEDGVQ